MRSKKYYQYCKLEYWTLSAQQKIIENNRKEQKEFIRKISQITKNQNKNAIWKSDNSEISKSMEYKKYYLSIFGP